MLCFPFGCALTLAWGSCIAFAFIYLFVRALVSDMAKHFAALQSAGALLYLGFRRIESNGNFVHVFASDVL